MKSPMMQAMMRGGCLGCPNCGQRSIYQSYLKVKDSCTNCGLKLSDYSADDFPPYMVMFLVGAIVVPLIFLTDQWFELSHLMLMAIWLPISLAMILLLLPPVKGAIIGVLWALNMKKDDHRQ